MDPSRFRRRQSTVDGRRRTTEVRMQGRSPPLGQGELRSVPSAVHPSVAAMHPRTQRRITNPAHHPRQPATTRS